MNPRFKRLVFGALTALLALFLCLLISEAVLRLTLYNFKPYPVSPGPNSEYVMETPEFKTRVHTNSLNMRDYEIPPKEAGGYRVLSLGDSFTFGLGVSVDESYPKILEKFLREEDPKFSVVNGGTGGNVKHAHDFLLEKGLSFQPDLVTAQVYIGNDFYDTLGYLEAPQVQAAAAPPKPPGPLQRFKSAVRGVRLRTVEFLWSRLIQVDFIDDILYKMNLRYDNRGIYLKNYPPLEQKLAQGELEGLSRLKETLDREGIGLLLLFVPAKQQVFKKHLLQDDKYDYRRPNDILRRFCVEKEIAFIDFLDIYERLPEAQRKRFYYAQDQHWTVAGHRLAAEALKDYVLSEAAAATS